MREMSKNLSRSYQIDNTKFLSETEIQALKSRIDALRKTHERDTLLIDLALSTGARESELLNITKDSLIPQERAVLIHGLKGSNNREIPLREALFLRLLNFAKEKEGLIFPITARRVRQIWRSLSPVNKKFHALRHTFAIELYKRHRDLRLVQVALGHRNINNTMVYAQYIYQRDEMRRLIC